MSRINTNVPSLVAARVMGKNQEALNLSLERLSTGLRINKGRDDPAGLIASEALRGEITAIQAAIGNTQRAHNVVAVAEGSLQEVNALLLDLESLVDQTANSAGLSSEEVAANQLQIDSILDSVNRIAGATEFQGKKLLNGSLAYTTSDVTTGATASAIADLQINSARIAAGSSRSVVVEVTQSAQTARLAYAGSSIGAGGVTLQIGGKYGIEQLSFASGTGAGDVVTAVNASKALTGVSATNSGGSIYFSSTGYGSEAFVSVEAISGSFTVTGGDSSTKDYGQDVGLTINGVTATTSGLDASINSTALGLKMTLASEFATSVGSTKTFSITGGGATFSISPTLGLNAMASLGIQNVATGSLGRGDIGYLSSLGSGQTNQLSSENFETAQRIVREASSQISSLRGRLGAFQKNTLETTVNSLSVILENTMAAESAIRDADFAAETSKLTRAQILVNASTSVLQIANAQPRAVLSLMGG
ncbi:MAG TPA: flagellin [Phycisphaerae bacterium]|nr:flagellin [Phycisphaerae bacterium]